MLQMIQKMNARWPEHRLSAIISPVALPKWQSFFAIMLLSRARVGPGLTPFATAAFAAGLSRADMGPVMLMGCALGAFMTGWSPQALLAPVACALTYVIYMLLGVVKRIRLDTSSRAAVAAGFAVLLPGLVAVGYAPELWLLTTFCAALSAVCVPILMAREVWWCETGRYMIFAVSFVLAAAGLGLSPAPVAVSCAVLAAGVGRGAIIGALLGAVCALTGDAPGNIALTGAMGAAAELVSALPMAQVWRSVAAMVTYGAVAPFLDVELTIWLPLAAALPALLPPEICEKFTRSCAPPAQKNARLMLALQKRAGNRLNALSDAFSGLSEACGAGDPAFGEQQLITRMRAALCAGCSEYEKCWPGANSSAVRLFCQLMTSAIECGGSPFVNGEVPPDIMRLCRRGMTVPGRLGPLLSDFAAQRHRRIRLMEARRLIGAQFAQTSGILSAMAAEQTRPFMLRDGAAAHVRADLMAAGLPVKEVAAVKLDKLEFTVELDSPWSREQLSRAAPVISAAMDRAFDVNSVSGGAATFVPAGRFRANAGMSALAARKESPCGDSCLIRSEAGRLFVAISDGMGSGEAAAEESGRVTSLMHSMISAGLPRELAAATVNGVMLSRGGEELFATADMLLIDLDTGMAEFMKLAACRSYIVRGGRIHAVEGGQLPLGILDEVTPGLRNVKLHKGDMVYMMTDGVTDAMSEARLAELMLEGKRGDPEELAQQLIEAASHTDGRRDDMTAVCIRIA